VAVTLFRPVRDLDSSPLGTGGKLKGGAAAPLVSVAAMDLPFCTEVVHLDFTSAAMIVPGEQLDANERAPLPHSR
jgi:hypothetical protein